jgi:hypothetical protein
VWLLNISHGFVPVVMEAAGAREVALRIGQPIVEREDRGIELVSASFTVTWAR